MPSGGSGRGQGRPLSADGLNAVVARVRRAVDRLAARRELPQPEIAFAAINLNIQVNRLLALAGLERPPELTPPERDASHAWAVQAVADEDNDD